MGEVPIGSSYGQTVAKTAGSLEWMVGRVGGKMSLLFSLPAL